MSSILKTFIKAFSIMLWMAQLQYLSDSQTFEELGTSFHDKMLTNHVKESLNTTAGLGDCFMTCAVREFCVSINYHHVTGVCDLNDATDETDPDDMRNASQVSYMTYSLRQPAKKEVTLVFPRKSIEDQAYWLNPFSSLQVFSLSFWVLVNPATDKHSPFHYNNQNSNINEIAVHLWSSNQNYFYIRQNSIIISQVVIDNKWHHLAMTWDSSNNGQSFVYIDGVQRGTKNVAAGETIPSGVLYLGRHRSPLSAEALQGQLTKVQMWSRVLSQAEVTSLASDRCADTLIGDLMKWPDLVAKRSGQVTDEPCQP